jgi:hypothetical protein
VKWQRFADVSTLTGRSWRRLNHELRLDR